MHRVEAERRIHLGKTFTLWHTAEMLAKAGSFPDSQLDFYYQVFRGWSQRGVLDGKRTGAGKTSPLVFSLEDICRARILLSFRQAFGTDGDELRTLNEKLKSYRKTIPTVPKGRTFSLAAAIEAIPTDKDWWLRVYVVKDRKTGIQQTSFYIAPLKFLPDFRQDYRKDPHFAMLSVTDIDLGEALSDIIKAANA